MHFLDWVVQNHYGMFPIYREPRISLEGLIHFLLRRVNGFDYEALMFMTLEKRDSYFKDEYEIYEEELKEYNKNKGIS